MLSKIIIIQKFIRRHLILRRRFPYKFIKYYFNRYLKDKGCKLPAYKSNMAIALECLYINIKKEINIDDVKKYCNSLNSSLQIRHLGLQYGYNILKGGDNNKNNQKVKKSHYVLLNLTSIYPSFCCDKRKIELDIVSWRGIKRTYDDKCVNCGSKENECLRWNKNKITVLQYGHMDPRKPLTINNVIPQCSICNQQYKNKAIFNKRGFVINFDKKGF
jgi:hypothetical protein